MAGLVPVIGDLINKINSLVDTNNAPYFNTVAVWNDQVKRMKDGSGYSLLTPACFIEIEESNEMQLGMGVTSSDLTITFHVVHEELDAIDGTLDQNLNVFGYRDIIKRYFTKYSPTQCGHMGYIHEKQDYSHNNIYQFNIQFKVGYIDTVAYPLQDGDQVIFDPPVNIVVDYEGITTPPAINTPYFWNVSDLLPTPSGIAASLDTAHEVDQDATTGLSIIFGATGQYIWFAVPQTTPKSVWMVNVFNTGAIGGAGNLFGSPTVELFTDPLGKFIDVNYDVYISNYATMTSGAMIIR